MNFPNLQRTMLLVAGLLVTTIASLLIGKLSTSVVLLTENDLETYWRTSYDILVRPPLSRASIEEKHGLVEANYLSQLVGGISFNQYQAVAAIPDLEVAAPIAILTSITDDLSFATSFPNPTTSGVYLFENTLDLDNGIEVQQENIEHYYYLGPEPSTQINEQRLFVNQPIYPHRYNLYLLLSAIDPIQENKLVSLEQAIVRGRYLHGEIQIYTDILDTPLGSSIRVNNVPILINATPYSSFTLSNRLSRVILPYESSTLETIVDQGGAEYLDTLATELIIEQTVNSDEAYPKLIDNLWNPRGIGSVVSTYNLDKFWQPVVREYQEIALPFSYPGLALDVVLPPPPEGNMGTVVTKTFTLKAQGVFDIENIPQPANVNQVPLETYFPPVVTLLYDESGQAAPNRLMQPTLGPRSYVLSPPLMLTTLEAARAITNDDCASCISAIRVRVALEGCPGDYLTCPLTPQNQRKIETIAGEIHRLTGLDVDIMVGSSPTRVLVHVPGVGYVEEQWIQKNVTATYSTRVQSGHLLLLGGLLGIGGLFVLDLAWAEVVARRRTIALQKALGWRSSTVFGQVLGQIALAGVAAAVVGTLVAWGLSGMVGWETPSLSLLIGVPLLIVGLALLGGVYPAWLAAHVPPAVGVRRGHAHVKKPSTFNFRRASLFRLSWQGLARRWSRTALGALTATLSAALLVLMLAVTVDRQGAMSGTLLGEFILVRIEGYHYAIVGIGFGLAALSLANSLLASVLERRREIGVFKAVGWQTGTVARLFLYEGALIGALGGLTGALLGIAVFVGLYEIITPSLLWIGLSGAALPAVVGLLAALYPARVAANVPPAEAVRYE